MGILELILLLIKIEVRHAESKNLITNLQIFKALTFLTFCIIITGTFENVLLLADVPMG